MLQMKAHGHALCQGTTWSMEDASTSQNLGHKTPIHPSDVKYNEINRHSSSYTLQNISN